MKKINKLLCVLMSVLLLFSFTACSNQSGITTLLEVPSNLSTSKECERTVMNGDIFVSPDGDDNNTGAKDSPVKTVEKALALARHLDKEQKVISFSSGDYGVSAIKLTQEDNGTVLQFLCPHDREFQRQQVPLFP